MLIPESFESIDGRAVTLCPGDLFRYFPESRSFGLERAGFPLFAIPFGETKAVRTWKDVTDAHLLPPINDEYAGDVVDAIVRKHDRALKSVPRAGRENEWVLVLH